MDAVGAMNWVPWVAGTGGAAIALLLLIFRRHGQGGAAARATVHLASLAAFAIAGVAIARGGSVWSGVGLAIAGAAWCGFFWILFIRARAAAKARSLHPASERAAHASEIDAAAEAEADLEPGGRALLSRLLALEKVQVSELLVPRERIVYADLAGGLGEVLDKIRSTGHLRIPMADGSLDRIVGIAYAKDLIPLAAEGRPSPPLKGRIRRPIFVPKDRTAASLLDLFRSQRGHLAIVVDEYSRTAGLVTRDDVFRRLAGETGIPRTAGPARETEERP